MDIVHLFVSKFNPPTMDHVRAIDALLKKGMVWVCPIDEAEAEMCSMLCADLCSQGKLVTYCSVGIDLGLDAAGIKKWCETKYGSSSIFRTAALAEEKADIRALFFGEKVEGDNISVGPFVRAGDIVSGIKAGKDESRNVLPVVWAYIQKKRLYR